MLNIRSRAIKLCVLAYGCRSLHYFDEKSWLLFIWYLQYFSSATTPHIFFVPTKYANPLASLYTWQLCIWFFSLYANNIFVRQAAFMLCHIISWILCWHAFVRMNINFFILFYIILNKCLSDLFIFKINKNLLISIKLFW